MTMTDSETESDIIQAKKKLRAQMKDMLSRMFSEENGSTAAAARNAADYVFTLPAYKKAQNVLIFLSCGHEISTEYLIQHITADGKRLAVPRIVPGTSDMSFFFLDSSRSIGSQTETGSYDITEPLASLERIEVSCFPEKTLILVPGLAFTESGWRLGKGKGFYDRYLAGVISLNTGTHLPLALTAFCFSRQIVASLPHDADDIPLTHIICEKGITVCDRLSL